MMPIITSIVSTPSQWAATTAQKFFESYKTGVEHNEFRKREFISRYYAPDVVFHNCNATTYHGQDEMYVWMKDLFAPFEKMWHPIQHCMEISNGDGTCLLYMRWERHIWMKGNEDEEPDVKSPMFFEVLVGPAGEGEGQGTLGLQMKEVRLYWDTAPLMKFMGKAAVAFRTQNAAGKDV